MMKRTLLVLSVAVLGTVAIWLMPGQQAVELFPAGGSSLEPEVEAKREGAARQHVAAQQEPAVEEVGEAEETVLRSPRHAAGEIERHRAIELRLKELKKSVKDQEEKVEERRKVLTAIVRTKGIIYKGRDMRIDAPGQAPATDPAAAEAPVDPELQAELNKKDAEERGRDAMAYVDAKHDFETDRELLKQMRINYDEERRKLEAGVR